MIRIGRTLPPAVAPIFFRDIITGIFGIFKKSQEINRFESEFKDYFDVKHCFLISSGKAALTIILRSLKKMHPDQDEILIPAFICYSVPSAITRAGLKIKLCDINADTLDFNIDLLAKTLNSTNRLLAIIPAHLFGIPTDIKRYEDLINGSCRIIEDAAQAMGSELDGRKLGTMGDVGFFSLGRGKALSTVEGGVILTNNEKVAETINEQIKKIPDYTFIEQMKLLFYAVILNIFMRPSLFWIPKSLPFLKLGETVYDPKFNIKKMSAFQAGLARGWQKKLKNLSRIRKTNSEYCTRIFSTQSFNSKLKTQNSKLTSLIRFPFITNTAKQRDIILQTSAKQGLGIMPTYPDSINGINELKNQFEGQNFPAAKEYANNLITLPVHQFISHNDKTKIADLIKFASKS